MERGEVEERSTEEESGVRNRKMARTGAEESVEWTGVEVSPWRWSKGVIVR